MPKKVITDTEVAGRRVLIRVDFNVPIKGGAITDDRRIEAALPTIKSVVERGGRAVLMSHLGRPEGTGYEAEYSLEPCAKRLSELLGKPVAFPSEDCVDGAAAEAVSSMQDGDVVLLENLRFHNAEMKGEATFAAKLAAYGEVYCNDAFGTAHREHASMVGVPERISGPKVSGLLLEKEIRYLSETLSTPDRPFVVILGGAKVSDKLPAIDNLMTKADHILVGGAMAYTFLKALGKRVGTSRVQDEFRSSAKKMLDHSANHSVQIHLPQDHISANQFSESAQDIEVTEDEHIADGYMGLDIGPKTVADYARIIGRARTVVWNGPMGVFEWRPFRVGTKQIAQAVADATAAGATSIVGGGDSAAAAEQFGVADRLTHVSTGGGASLEMLEGKRFKSVDLLDNA